MSGHLTKLGFCSAKWQRRWFVLKSTELIYYAAPNGNEKGRILLDGSSCCECVHGHSQIDSSAMAAGVRPRQPVPPMALKLTARWKDGTRAFYLGAESEFERDQWLNLLTSRLPTTAPSVQALVLRSSSLPPEHQGVPISGPSPPATSSRTLPLLPKPTTLQHIERNDGKSASVMDMLEMAGKLMSTVHLHQNNPHMSQEDNAMALGQKIQGTTGKIQHDEALLAALQDITKYHLPEGLFGFLVRL